MIRINILKQEIISAKKRETLTEPHYMFCRTVGFRGTLVEERCCTLVEERSMVY